MLGNQVKIVDTLKCYQQSLTQLASTVTREEIASVKKLTKQFICSHNYFVKAWSSLDYSIGSGKGVITYEKITDLTDSNLDQNTESLCKCSKFFSKLKQKLKI